MSRPALAALALLALTTLATGQQNLAASPAASQPLAEDVAVQPLDGGVMAGLGNDLVGKYVSTMQAEANSLASIVTSAASGLGAAAGGIGGKVRNAAATADALLSAYRGDFCAPAQYVPSGKVPANFTSPGFSLTFSLGNCSLGLATGASVSCVGPYTRFRMTPAVLTGPYVRPGFFVGEQCAAAAAFGGVQRTVLAVLDKNAKLIPSQIAAQVSGAVSGVVAALPQPSVPGVPLAGFLGGVGSSSATAATDGGGVGAAGAVSRL